MQEPNCGHEWFSKAHSTILFQYDPISHRIKWRKFGQKCRQCHRSEYHQAHYGDEQIERTIDYLLKKLILKVYNINLTVDPPQLNYNNNRGDDLACYCEACMSGNYCRKQD
ncbi:unnamed protein product [Didymodactylos carnosus]|uniref:3CxxC-type domain-containing protein n=1 Tax=Didymodactylos carnosus TaxID=1234261 RepID=A0A8S2TS91_9BILA|nr:unnamed protein product [Didymodactylos carnosus]CAF4305821.1 unnamed protein product [Didymodactylos carnosus]